MHPIGMYGDQMQAPLVFGDASSFKRGGPAFTNQHVWGSGSSSGALASAQFSGKGAKGGPDGGDSFVRTYTFA